MQSIRRCIVGVLQNCMERTKNTTACPSQLEPSSFGAAALGIICVFSVLMMSFRSDERARHENRYNDAE